MLQIISHILHFIRKISFIILNLNVQSIWGTHPLLHHHHVWKRVGTQPLENKFKVFTPTNPWKKKLVPWKRNLSIQPEPGWRGVSPQDQRTTGPEDQTTRGPKDQTTRGPQDQRTTGPEDKQPEDQRTKQPEDHRTRGPQDQRTKQPEDQRTKQPEDHRARGT